ncbi:prepilin peptidase [Candidatus Latescibacterota bacterium]
MDIERIFYLSIVIFSGLSLGSFLNVVIYRLPRKESLFFPSSHCPACNEPIRYFDNIPILSYLLLGGKCRWCAVKISSKYPLIEFITASIAVGLFFIHGLTINFASDLCLATILLSSALIDSKHMIIPNSLNLTGGIFAVFFSLFKGMDGIFRSILGALTGFVILSAMFYMGKLFYKREGVGMGDVKLALVIGLFLGPFWCLISLLLAITAGGIWGIAQLTIGKRLAGKEIPFGPFIAFGGFLVLFFRLQILYLFEQYLSLF